MNVIFTARKSSAVFHAIKGNFTGPDDLNLILDKGTRVEVYLIGRDGIKLLKEFSIYGEIASIEAFRPAGHTTDMLLITTSHYQMLTLSLRFSAPDDSSVVPSTTNTPQFNIHSDSLLDLQDRHSRPSDSGQILAIDPTSSVICCHLYHGLLKCITVNPHAPSYDANGTLAAQTKPGGSSHSFRSRTTMTDKTFLDQFNIPIEEVNVVSMTFLHGCTRPTLAVLYQDSKEMRHVKTYEIDLKNRDKSETGWAQSGLSGALALVAVPSPVGGLLVIGEYAITYLNPMQQMDPLSITMNATIMKCFNRVDDYGSRYLLGDHRGMLYVLVLEGVPGSSTSQSTQLNRIKKLSLNCLGTISIPEAVVYLDNGHVFVGSHLGDSQLILLRADPEENGEHVDVLDTFTNIGPVTDFEVVDLEGQGQGQIVSCSGAYKDGALRIVRNGVGINDKAVLELPGIKGLWSLKETLDATMEDTLVMSFLNSTRVVKVTRDMEMVQVDMDGLLSGSTTLLCGNVQESMILQVTPTAVRLIAPSQHIQAGLVQEWVPPAGQIISVASMNGSQCLVAVGGKTLVFLDIGSGAIKEAGRTAFDNEIACIDVSSLDPLNKHVSTVCAVGLWTDIRVVLVRLPTMDIVATHGLVGEILPRSLLMTRFEGVPHLLVGLGDGQLLTFLLDNALNSLGQPKRISLGTQPIMLRPISSAQGSTTSNHVFACSDRPTVIYSSNRKLLYSNVNVKQVATVCSFNCEAFPNALAIVGSDEEGLLRIGSIDEFQELHVQSFPIQEGPRRIAYLASKKCFGVLSVRVVTDEIDSSTHSELIVNKEGEVGSIRIHDDQTFDLMHSYELQETEIPSSITAVTFTGDPTSYIAVGTAYELEEEDEPSKGRILILEVTESSQLKLVHELEVKGGVMSIKEFNGKLLCGVNGRLCLYSWNSSEKSVGASLTLDCTHYGYILVLWIAVHGDFIIVGDVMRSLTLLRYKAHEKKIEEIARDSNMSWLTAMEAIDDETFIAADNANNIFTLVKNTDTTSEDEAKRLQWVGGWHVGDQINRFKHGSLVMSNQEGDAPAVPKLLFATVSGAIGVVATLSPDKYELFHQLEQNMTRVIKGVGGLDHASWRKYRNEKRTLTSTNFVDGDLIQMFLDLSEDEMNDVMMGANEGQPLQISIEEMTKLVEELLRLH